MFLLNLRLNKSLQPFFSSKHLINYRLISHPSDKAKVVIPKVDDRTNWIKPNLTEYYQIRKRLREESDDHIERTFYRTLELRFWDAQATRNLIKDPEPLDNDYARYQMYGDDAIGNSKAMYYQNRFHFPCKEDDDPETPLDILRQLKSLKEYTGIERPDEYIFLVRQASLLSVFRKTQEKIQYNKYLQNKQKLLMDKFDKDSEKLLEDMTKMKDKLVKKPLYINDTQTQETLRKWYTLKVEFSSKIIGEGKLSPFLNEIDSKDKNGKNIEEVTSEKVKISKSFNKNTKYDKIEKEIIRENKHLVKLKIAKEEALNLLADDSILSLIENMKDAISKYHKSLLLLMDKDMDGKLKPSAVMKKFLKLKFYREKRRIYLERIKNNRWLDPSVKLRFYLRDPRVTKKERLARSLYDRLYKQRFDERRKYIQLLSWKKSDYNFGDAENIKLNTISQFESGLDTLGRDGEIAERSVKVIVSLSDLNFSNVEMNALRKIFPNLIYKNRELHVSCDCLPTKNQNAREALKTLENIIKECKIFSKIEKCEDWDSYVDKRKQLIKSCENIDIDDKKKDNKEFKKYLFSLNNYKNKLYVTKFINNFLLLAIAYKNLNNNDKLDELKGKIDEWAVSTENGVEDYFNLKLKEARERIDKEEIKLFDV